MLTLPHTADHLQRPGDRGSEVLRGQIFSEPARRVRQEIAGRLKG